MLVGKIDVKVGKIDVKVGKIDVKVGKSDVKVSSAVSTATHFKCTVFVWCDYCSSNSTAKDFKCTVFVDFIHPGALIILFPRKSTD